MKRLLLLSAMLLIASSLFAQANVSFAWDYGTPAPTGFEMRFTSTSTPPVAPYVFDCSASPGNTCTVTSIPVGAWNVQAFAYTIGVPAELKSYSDGSNIVAIVVPAKPAAPGNLKPGTATMAFVLTWPVERRAIVSAKIAK